jgi:hypothetical protein
MARTCAIRASFHPILTASLTVHGHARCDLERLRVTLGLVSLALLALTWSGTSTVEGCQANEKTWVPGGETGPRSHERSERLQVGNNMSLCMSSQQLVHDYCDRCQTF